LWLNVKVSTMWSHIAVLLTSVILIASAEDFECPLEDGTYADAVYCSKFVHCRQGTAYQFTCPGDMVFNPLVHTCDQPDNYECAGLKQTTTTTTTEAPTTIKPCGGVLTDASGVITSPGGPDGYTPNEDCTWIIHAQHGHNIKLRFNSFHLEEKREGTCYDFLEIRNGRSPSSPIIGRFCGETVIPHLTSNTDAIYLHFVSDHVTSAGGFSLEYHTAATDESCYKASTDGEDYSGDVITTFSGKTCQRWDSETPHRPKGGAWKGKNFPEGDTTAAHSFCRNPTFDGDQPWCYTTDPDTRWENCGIAKCQ